MNSQATNKIVVIIVNWNGGSTILECLKSLRIDQAVGVGILVVDNASTDDSVARIREAFPATTVMEMTENLGFAGGNNVGIEKALADGATHLLLLNNDTIVEEGLFPALLDAAGQHPEAGIISTKIVRYDKPDEIEAAGGRIDLWRGRSHLRGNGEFDKGQYDSIESTGFCPGTVMFVRAEVFKRCGIFDERFFMYQEDADLCLRAVDEGFSLLCTGGTRVLHKTSASLGGYMNSTSFFYASRNAFYLIRKHGTWLQRLHFSIYALGVYPLMLAAYSLIHRRPDLLPTYARATWAYFHHNMGGPAHD